MTYRIAIASAKGGTGKSTTAIHLSHYLGLKNHKTLLIDCDEQNYSSVTWWQENQDEKIPDHKKFAFSTLKLEDYDPDQDEEQDFIIFDTRGGLEGENWEAIALHTDLIIIPCPPAALDFGSLIAKLPQIASEANYRVLIVKANQLEAEEAQEVLSEHGHPYLKKSIRKSKGFDHAAFQSVPVNKIKQSSQKLGALDYEDLAKEVIAIAGGTNEP